jgi:hypothetical protein
MAVVGTASKSVRSRNSFGASLHVAVEVDNVVHATSTITSTRGVMLLPGYTKRYLPVSIATRPVKVEVPALDLVIAYRQKGAGAESKSPRPSESSVKVILRQTAGWPHHCHLLDHHPGRGRTALNMVGFAEMSLMGE